MEGIKIKVCGMRVAQNIEAIGQLGIDWMGFIFFDKSKRDASSLDPMVLNGLNEKVKRVGVFVNADLEMIQQKIKTFRLNVIQLHGDESPAFCRSVLALKVKVVKVFTVGNHFDFEQLAPYDSYCDYFLFDTKGEERGGNGIAFNWKILKSYSYQKPFLLSGGISPETVLPDFLAELPMWGLDINSRFELEPGLKNVEEVNSFIQKIKSNAISS